MSCAFSRGIGHLELKLGKKPAAGEWRPRWFDAAERILRGDLAGAAEVCWRIGSLPEESEAHMHAAEQLPPDDPRRSEHARMALDFYRRVGASALIRRCEEVVD